MNDSTVNALLRLLAIQQVQIVTLRRLVSRRKPDLPVTSELAAQAWKETDDQVGEKIEQSVRDTYRTLMLNQEIEKAGLLDLWASGPDEGPSGEGEDQESS